MDKLGQYHVQRKVEAGKGATYLASDAGSGRPATLKLVRFTEETPSDQQVQLLRSLYDEVRAAAVLQHPNIAQVFEVFQHEGKTWIATEVATDKNLANLLVERSPLAKQTILETLRQVAEALDYAHEKGLVHRTVRPSNLGIQANGTVRVFGFGLSQYFLETPEGSSPGDLAYQAPELIRGDSVGGRCDQFSLAAIAYEMLTGEAPFQGTTDEQIRSHVLRQDPLPADGLNSAIGPEAARVLARGLAKNPADRYPSCRDFNQALQAALSRVGEWRAREAHKPVQGRSPAAGGASVESITSGVRRDVDSLVEDLVSELAGAPTGKELERRPPEAVTAAEGRGRGAAGEEAGGESLGEPAAMPGDFGAAETALTPSGAAGKSAEESGETRKVVIVAATAVIAAVAALLLYFGQGSGTTEQSGAVASQGLTFVGGAPPAASPGSAYRHALEIEGGTPPLRWEVEDGELPPGLALNASTGIIEGTARAAGTYPVRIAVTEAGGGRHSQSFELRVQMGLTVSTPSGLPSGVVGRLYQNALAVEGGTGPYRWSLAGGALPAGLSLNSDGLIVGRPQNAGTFEFRGRVSDETNATAEKAFSLRVGSGLTLLSASDLPASSVGTSYSHRLSAGGGAPPYRWSLSGGSLPDGIALERSTGQIHGEPSGAGRYSLEVMVRDSAGASAVQSFQLEVQSALRVVTTPELPKANLSRVYSKPLELEGGNWPYRWSLAGGALPRGLLLDESSGTIRGTPELAGSYEFDVQVRDAFKAMASQHFRLEVTTMLEIQTAHDLPEAVGPGVYSHTLRASGGEQPYLWSLVDGALPPNFSLDSTTGVLNGVPTARGDHRFTVEVNDGAGTKSTRLFRLTVIPALRFTERGTLPPAIAGERYTQALAVSGGQTPHSWSLDEGALPEGISLETARGVLEGTPKGPGKYRFAVSVADAKEASTRQFFELEVKPPAPGEMVWRGELPKDAVLIIQDGRYASVGTLTGVLPGVPIKIDLEPKEGLTVVTAPARANNWKVLVINASEPQTEIIIRWTPLSSQ